MIINHDAISDFIDKNEDEKKTEITENSILMQLGNMDFDSILKATQNTIMEVDKDLIINSNNVKPYSPNHHHRTINHKCSENNHINNKPYIIETWGPGSKDKQNISNNVNENKPPKNIFNPNYPKSYDPLLGKFEPLENSLIQNDNIKDIQICDDLFKSIIIQNRYSGNFVLFDFYLSVNEKLIQRKKERIIYLCDKNTLLIAYFEDTGFFPILKSGYFNRVNNINNQNLSDIETNYGVIIQYAMVLYHHESIGLISTQIYDLVQNMSFVFERMKNLEQKMVLLEKKIGPEKTIYPVINNNGKRELKWEAMELPVYNEGPKQKKKKINNKKHK